MGENESRVVPPCYPALAKTLHMYIRMYICRHKYSTYVRMYRICEHYLGKSVATYVHTYVHAWCSSACVCIVVVRMYIRTYTPHTCTVYCVSDMYAIVCMYICTYA